MVDKQQSDYDTCDRLAAYELGLLADSERVEFEAHLVECSECLNEIYAHAPAAVALTSDPGKFREACAQALSVARPGPWQRVQGWFANNTGGRVLAPLTVAAALALVFLWPGSNVDQSYRGLAVLDPLSYSHIDVRAGAGDSTVAVFERGMEFYVTGDYEAAAVQLAVVRHLLDQSPESAPARQVGFSSQSDLYRGVSLLLSGNVPAAVVALNSAAASPIRPVQQRAQWYLVQAYLLSDQPDAAEEVLGGLVRSPVYGEQARTLLAALHEER